jgi:hypothetical protein
LQWRRRDRSAHQFGEAVKKHSKADNLQSIPVFTGSSLFEKTTLDIGYRYTAADDFNQTARDGTRSSTDFRSNAVTFGLRKKF